MVFFGTLKRFRRAMPLEGCCCFHDSHQPSRTGMELGVTIGLTAVFRTLTGLVSLEALFGKKLDQVDTA